MKRVSQTEGYYLGPMGLIIDGPAVHFFDTERGLVGLVSPNKHLDNKLDGVRLGTMTQVTLFLTKNEQNRSEVLIDTGNVRNKFLRSLKWIR